MMSCQALLARCAKLLAQALSRGPWVLTVTYITQRTGDPSAACYIAAAKLMLDHVPNRCVSAYYVARQFGGIPAGEQAHKL
jgi:hypothetical protein